MSERYYYLSEYADESIPCDPTLHGWAEWLSKPDEDWHRNSAASDGEAFNASVIRFERDIVAIYDNGAWRFSRPVGPADFLAVRFGEGLGWSSEQIVWGEDMSVALTDWLAECGEEGFSPTYIAVGFNELPVCVIYQGGPPPSLEIEGIVQ